MEVSEHSYGELLQSGAKRLTGHQRRLFQAEVCLKLCGGNTRQAERRFGDEEITIRRLEAGASRIRPAFVIAGDDNRQTLARIATWAEPRICPAGTSVMSTPSRSTVCP